MKDWFFCERLLFRDKNFLWFVHTLAVTGIGKYYF